MNISYQDVVNAGKSIEIPNSATIDNTIMIIIGILAVITMIAVIIDSNNMPLAIAFFAVMLLILGTGSMTIKKSESNEYASAVDEWKSEFVEPYISSIEPVIHPISDVKINNGIYDVTFENNQGVTETKTINESDEQLTQFTFEKPPGESAEIRFVEIKRDLGHGIDAGVYSYSVHLNEK